MPIRKNDKNVVHEKWTKLRNFGPNKVLKVKFGHFQNVCASLASSARQYMHRRAQKWSKIPQYLGHARLAAILGDFLIEFGNFLLNSSIHTGRN